MNNARVVLLRCVLDTSKDLAEMLHEPAIRDLMPCRCADERARSLELQRQQIVRSDGSAETNLRPCANCQARHTACELQRALNGVLEGFTSDGRRPAR